MTPTGQQWYCSWNCTSGGLIRQPPVLLYTWMTLSFSCNSLGTHNTHPHTHTWPHTNTDTHTDESWSAETGKSLILRTSKHRKPDVIVRTGLSLYALRTKRSDGSFNRNPHQVLLCFCVIPCRVLCNPASAYVSIYYGLMAAAGQRMKRKLRLRGTQLIRHMWLWTLYSYRGKAFMRIGCHLHRINATVVVVPRHQDCFSDIQTRWISYWLLNWRIVKRVMWSENTQKETIIQIFNTINHVN